jgi:uncharacterized membrane protein
MAVLLPLFSLFKLFKKKIYKLGWGCYICIVYATLWVKSLRPGKKKP